MRDVNRQCVSRTEIELVAVGGVCTRSGRPQSRCLGGYMRPSRMAVQPLGRRREPIICCRRRFLAEAKVSSCCELGRPESGSTRQLEIGRSNCLAGAPPAGTLGIGAAWRWEYGRSTTGPRPQASSGRGAVRHHAEMGCCSDENRFGTGTCPDPRRGVGAPVRRRRG